MSCKPRMRGCKAACLHREMVRDYHMERERQERRAEDDYRERDGQEPPPLITFQDWLKGRRHQ